MLKPSPQPRSRRRRRPKRDRTRISRIVTRRPEDAQELVGSIRQHKGR